MKLSLTVYRLIRLKANSHGAMCSDNLYAILVVTTSHLRLVHGNNSVWPTKVVTMFPFTRCDSAKPNKLSLQIVLCESVLMANSHGAIRSDNLCGMHVVTTSHLRLVHRNNSVWPTKVDTIFPFTRCDSAKPNKLSLRIAPCESTLIKVAPPKPRE